MSTWPLAGGLALFHRRLAVGMAGAGLVAFTAGIGFTAASPYLAAIALLVALIWRPSPALSARLEHLWLPLAFVLVARALFHVLAVRGDVVIPVVDLLLLLLCAEALRSLDALNDVRLYALSFALLLASTAYRPGIVFAVAFLSYVVLATLALMVGHLRRQGRRYGIEDVPLRWPVIATTLALAGVTLVTSVLVFLTFPRVSQGWAGRGELLATSVAGFSDEVSLGQFGATIQSNPEIVLRVEFPTGLPSDLSGLHWRGRSYDRFDGVRWSRSENMRVSSGSRTWYRRAWPPGRIEHRVYGAPLQSRVLFGLHPLVRVEPESPIHPLTDHVGDHFYWGSGVPAYTAISVAASPPAEELRLAESGYMPDRTHYLQVPRLPGRMTALADSLTEGLQTRYDVAAAIEGWLRSEFAYTRDLPATARETTLEHFLFDRRAGHCEYFSTAMVMLLRTQGIHSRNVNGFLGGSWNAFGEYLVVTQNEAHSWVEVWFPDYGWVTFDPTPVGAAGAAGAEAWFWPGRFLFDGVQHQWSKWVLDYSLQNQNDFLGLALDYLRGEGATGEAVEGGRRAPTSRLFLILGAIVLAFGAAGLLLRGGENGSRETRIYSGLVHACRRAGLVRGQVAPLELVDRLRQSGSPAAAPASRLVDLYARARFAGESLRDEERSEMTRALAGARRFLRKRGAGAA